MSSMLMEKVKATLGWSAPVEFPAVEDCKVPESEEVKAAVTQGIKFQAVPTFELNFPEIKVPEFTATFIGQDDEKPVGLYAGGITKSPLPAMELYTMKMLAWTGIPHREETEATQRVLVKFCQATREVVEEAGMEHVCQPQQIGGASLMRYIHEGKGDCLVGRVLVKMGYSPNEISMYEGMPASVVAHNLLGGSAELVSVAQNVQTINDSRMHWGRALNHLTA